MSAQEKKSENLQQNKDISEIRYLVKVALIAARRSQSNKKSKKQYYFEVGKKSKQRTPTRGYFEFNFEGSTDLKEPVTLFTEIIKSLPGKEIEVMLEFKEKNENIFKVDESISKLKMSHNTGDKRQIFTINDDNLELRIAMSITPSAV